MPFGVEIDPRILIYSGIREGYRDARLVRELSHLVGARIRRLSASPIFLRDVGLPPAGDLALAELDGPGLDVTEAWLRETSERRVGAKAALLALLSLDLIDVNRRAVAPAPASKPAAAGPRKRTGITGMNMLEPKEVARMAEAFFKNGDLGRAERAFELALKSDFKNQRLKAFATWINFWKPGTDRAQALPEATKTIREAVRADPQFAYGHYFVGALQKLANDSTAAARSFKAALEADATLVDAQRELRLLNMRKAKN
jgi:tetratricopeptide (TPR) repeat protein